MGSRLVPELIDAGFDVTVVDPLWFGNHLPEAVQLWPNDVLHLAVEKFTGFDTVIFLAGLASDPMANFSPPYNFVSNIAAPVYAAYAARAAGVTRFIFADSCSVYGDSHGDLCTEDMSTKPAYPYGISKAQAAQALQALCTDTFSVISMRKGTVSGWSPRMRFDLLVNAMYASAAAKGKVTVNNPSIWRPFLDLDDAVHAYITAVRAPRGHSGIFNIATSNITVGEVGEKVQKHFQETHGRDVVLDVLHISDARDYKASVRKATDELFFTGKGSVENVLHGLDEHFGPEFDFSNEDYYNIKVFERLVHNKHLGSLS